ncbi:MAG: DOMON-like domain-containing protein [Bdellovibrionaceae bacterium]|nr:DOMON-like domain-containing protein [Pseudobdellovibrionaceae bacterium]
MDLRVFPGTPVPEGLTIHFEADWSGGVLSLRYRLNGPVARFRGVAESSVMGLRRDELWKTTCFEIFVRPEGSRAYWEFNFSPTGDWAFYRFDSYRQGQSSPPLKNPPLTVFKKQQGWEFSVTADLSDQFDFKDRALVYAPAVILENGDGDKSYWALEHHRPQPDFHHPDNLVRLLLPKGPA